MEPIITHGTPPGWVFEHRAAAVGGHGIAVWGGKIAAGGEGGESHRRNRDRFVLDLRRTWRREPRPERGSMPADTLHPGR